MNAAFNLDLLSVGISVAAGLILGFVVYIRNHKSSTNVLFMIFTAVTAMWTVSSYLAYRVTGNHDLVLFIIRLVMALAVLQAYSFFMLMHTFPSPGILLPKRKFRFITAFSLFVAFLTLTPLIFSSVEIVSGSVPTPVPGPAVPLFAFVAIPLVIAGIVSLVRKLQKAVDKERNQYRAMLIGVIMMFASIVALNFFATLLKDTSFIPLSPLFTLPFTVFVSYAIIRHGLLNIKVLGTEILIFLLVVVSFIEVVLSKTTAEVFLRVGVFSTILAVGFLLIRSVFIEVKHRQQLEELTEKLKELDQRKNEFISVAAHELRAPMTAIKGYLSMVLEGDTGKLSSETADYLTNAVDGNDRLIRLVNNMLNVARIEENRMVYQMGVVSLGNVVNQVFNEFKVDAERKGLKYSVVVPKESTNVYVDQDRIYEVVANLISNSVKYTDTGTVSVSVSLNKNMVKVEVVDTGRGITVEEQTKMFTKFGRAESSAGKTIGTGLGLYISKLLIEKFGGTIGIISESGKGSNFWFELPLANTLPEAK